MKTLPRHRIGLIRGIGLAFVLRGVGAGLAFLLHVAIARLVGPDGAGLFFLSLSVVAIAAVVSKLGLDNTVLHFVADAASKNDWNRVVGSFRLSALVSLGASMTAGVFVFLIAPWLSNSIFGEPDLVEPLQFMSFGIVTFAMMMVIAEALKGLMRVADSMVVSGLAYPVFSICALWPLVSVFETGGAALAYVIGTAGAALVGYFLWRRALRGHSVLTPTYPRTELWGSIKPLWAMEIINRAILPWAPLFLLGLWSTPAEAGIFGAATRVAMLVTFFLVAVNSVVSPRIAILNTHGDDAEIRRLAARLSVSIGLAASPLLAILFFAGDFVMGLFGPEFERGGIALAILAFGQAIVALTGVYGQVLLMTGRARNMRNGSVLALVLMLLSAVLLIPCYGMVGAAIANSVAIAAMNLYFAGSVIRSVKQ